MRNLSKSDVRVRPYLNPSFYMAISTQKMLWGSDRGCKSSINQRLHLDSRGGSTKPCRPPQRQSPFPAARRSTLHIGLSAGLNGWRNWLHCSYLAGSPATNFPNSFPSPHIRAPGLSNSVARHGVRLRRSHLIACDGCVTWR